MQRITERVGGTACALLLAFCVAASRVEAQDYFIMTVAGGLESGIPATSAALSNPYGVAVDGAGAVYIADTNSHCVRKVSAIGTITTAAGTGLSGFGGDGGPATAAALSAPWNVVVDGAGSLYIADSSNSRIRKVSAGGSITTVAGTGSATFGGDGGPATSAALSNPCGVAVDSTSVLFIADTNNHRIRKVWANGTIVTVAGTGAAAFGGDGGPATSAALYTPCGVAVGSAGALFIADYNNHRIRKVSTGGTITTVTGTGVANYSGDGGPATAATLKNPHSVVVDNSGALFIADTNNQRIRKVSAGGTITTVAGTGANGFSGDSGPATAAALSGPFGVAVDSGGTLFIVDTYNQRIRRVSTSGIIATTAGTGAGRGVGDGGPAAFAALSSPSGMSVDSGGALLIADSSGNRIRKVWANGTIATVVGTGSSTYGGDGGPATFATLYTPYGVAVDGAGALYFADSGNHRIRKVSSGGITTVVGTGAAGFSGDGGPATSAALYNPYGVAIDSAGALYIADMNNHRIRKVSAGGTITTMAGTGTAGIGGNGGLATSAALYNPCGVAMDSAGALHIADCGSHRVRKVWANGTITTVAGTGGAGFSGDGGPATMAALYVPRGVFVGTAGVLFIADCYNHRIRKILVNGTITTVAGTGVANFSGDVSPATSTALNYPYGVVVDSVGALYIADTNNHRIRKVSVGGTMTTVAGTGIGGFGIDGGPATTAALKNPRDVFVDSAGALYIADVGNNRIRKVSTGGTITTVAGSFSGDGGPATSATLSSPYRVAVDSAGGLYIADNGNHRIRKVSAGGTITTVAGTAGVGGFSGDGGRATAAALYYPQDVVVDRAGALYIADTTNQRIRKVSAGGNITTVAGSGAAGFLGDGGPATSAALYNPSGVVVDGAGALCIADYNNHRIRKVSVGGIITTAAGIGTLGFSGDGGPATSAVLYLPYGVAVDDDGALNLYIADNYNHRIRMVSAVGTITTVVGTGTSGFSGDGGAASSSALNYPRSVMVDRTGVLYIADTNNKRVRAVLPVSLSAPVQYFRPGMSIPAANVTLQGAHLGGVGSISIGGVACGAVVLVNATAIDCRDWPIAAAAALLTSSAQLPLAYNISLALLGVTTPVTGTLPQALTLILPPVVSLLGSPTAKGGDAFSINGFNFQALLPVANNTPSVFIGGFPCAALVVVTFDTLLRCTMPDVLSTTSGYPLLSVVVVNAAGQASNSTLTVEYPSRVTATFVTSPAQAVWPSSAATLELTAASRLTLLAGGSGTITCTLFVAACTTSTGLNPSDAAAGPAMVGENSLSAAPPSTTVPAVVEFNATGLYAPSGATCNMSAQCRDAQGQSATAPMAVTLTTPLFSLAWLDTPTHFVSAPSGMLPSLHLLFSADIFGAPPPQPLPTSLLTCAALLVANTTATAPPSGTPLIAAATYALASTTAVAITRTTNTTANATVTSLSVAACDLGAAYAIYSECTWTPTGERIRPPAPLQLRVPAVVLTLTPSATQLTAYEPFPTWAASATLDDATSDARVAFTSAAGTCAVQQVNTSSALLQLSPATLQSVLPIAANGTIAVVPLGLEGPPSAVLYARLACTVWGKTVVSPPMRLTTAPYLVAIGDSTAAPALASDALGATLFPVTIRAAAQGVDSIACSLAVNASSITCPSSSLSPAYGIAHASPPLSTLQLVGEASASVAVPPGATAAAVLFGSVGIRGGSGCIGNATVTCRDSTGRTASSAAFTGAAPSSSLAAAAGGDLLAPRVALSVAALHAHWDTSTPASLFTGLPPLPLPPINVTLLATDPASGASLAWPASAAASFTCIAVLLPQLSPALPWSTPLSSVSATALSSCPGAPASGGVGTTTLNWTIACLTAAAAPLGANYNLHAECTWLPTGERLRLPPVAVGIVDVRLSWRPPPRIVTQGYAAVNATLQLSVAVAAGSGGAPAITAACALAIVNTTLRTASVVAEPWSLTIDPAAASTAAMPITIVVQAPPGVTAFVRAECAAWGQTLASPPLRLTTASLVVMTTEPPPSVFLPSDPTAPWPVLPPLVLRVATVETNTTVADAACTLTTSTPGTTLAAADSGASLLAVAADALTGVITVPRFIVQAAIGGVAAVTLDMACKRALSGDAAPLFQLQLHAVGLRVDACVEPAGHSAMAVALPPFSFGIAARPPNIPAFDAPCVRGTPLHASLPPITCAVSLNLSASTTNDTANIFLQQAVALLDGTTHVASFDAFTVVAPQGETYGLTVACTIGSLPIPPAITFAVSLAGCPPGQESASVTCATCGGGQFSFGGMGATCTGCPPAGASCDAGILTLRPNFFRPASQAGQPLGPTTELHPCYNAEACTLTLVTNGTGAEYGCAPGYTGPLCGVCDAGANYARFGEACGVCWNPGASWIFLLLVGGAVTVVLTRVALRTETSRSDASIVLRITLSYLQAVGSLRVFRAGSTQAYSNVMGWTEVVSASPLGVGALQCILWLPYLVQYIATVALPLLAALAVAAIFVSVSAARSTHCRPRYSLDVPALRAAVRAWLASKRHLSTLLFVLFLTYMPIISASLRALDCVPPIAGLRYLRSDLGVECGVGQHAAARALAFTVLVVAGLGFPAGLGWLLGTATQTQLLDGGFHATWGFLFDGYREPKRTLVVAGTPAAALTSAGGSKPAYLLSARPQPTHELLPCGSDTSAAAAAPSGTAASLEAAAAAGSGPHLMQVVPERLTQHWAVSGDSRVWWEAVVLARKAGVVLLAVTVTNPYLQCVGATLWFAGAAVLQARYSPYTKPLFNQLEMATLAATFLTAVVSTTLLQFNVGVSSADMHAPATMTALEWAVTILLVLINLGTFIVLAGLWLRLQCRRARGIIRRVSVTAVSGRVAAVRVSLARRRSSANAPLGSALPPAGAASTPSGGGVGDAPAATMNPLRARAPFTALPGSSTGTGNTPRDVPPPTVAAGAAGDGGRAGGTAESTPELLSRRHVTSMPPAAASAAAPATATVATVATATAGAATAGGSGGSAGGTGSAVDLRGVSFAAIPVVRSRRPAPRA